MKLKAGILARLEETRDVALSGQTLAEQFGVSRNAVWKAVNALRDEGYEIESTPNRGYRLSPACDRLSEAGIQALLGERKVPVYRYDTVDSTNTQARRLVTEGAPEPLLVVAEEQTAGRGRRGRSFLSPRGAGLYMTVALTPGLAVESALGITAYAAVCVAEAVQKHTGLSLQIKWVNDLYLSGRKVCGILTEAVSDFESGTVESLLVGVGLNLRPAEMPAAIRDTVGSLACDAPLKNALAAEITAGMLRFVPGDGAYLEAYRARSMTLGRAIRYTQGERTLFGRAVEIAPDGALTVESPDGVRHALRSGEIALLPD